MLIIGTCTRAHGIAAAALSQRLASYLDSTCDRVLVRAGTGICSVYNQILRTAVDTEDCEAVILLHDDTYIIDQNFRAKIVSSFRNNLSLGVIGVVGASRISSLSWWESSMKVGQVYESRGFINFGSRRGYVDVVDGLLMAVSRRAFTQISFDEKSFPGFHGYDIDYCLQVRKAGLLCMVIPMEILHNTKGGVGNKEDFTRSNSSLLAKWKRKP